MTLFLLKNNSGVVKDTKGIFLNICKFLFQGNILNDIEDEMNDRKIYITRRQTFLYIYLMYKDLEMQDNLKWYFADLIRQSSRESFYNNVLYLLMSLRQKRVKATQKRYLFLSMLVSFLADDSEIVYENMLPRKDVQFVYRLFENR